MMRTRAAACLPFLALLAGCNAIFGVSDGELAEGGATSTGATTTVTTSTGGGGGAGGSGTGGGGGQGGQASCGQYDGNADVTATDTGNANLATITFTASQSVEGHFTASTQLTSFSIAGGQQQGFCAIGVDVTLTGDVAAGKTYAIVDRATYNDLTAFFLADNAFLTFRTADCAEPPVQKGFESVPGAGGGSVQITSIVGTVVTLAITNVQVDGWQDAEYDGQGTMTLDGTAHADCFYTAQ